MPETWKRFSRIFIEVGSLIARDGDGPYRTVNEIEKFVEVWRVWLEPTDDPEAPEYYDLTALSTVRMPWEEPTAASVAAEAREYDGV